VYILKLQWAGYGNSFEGITSEEMSSMGILGNILTLIEILMGCSGGPWIFKN
jgi:hypothetical protein